MTEAELKTYVKKVARMNGWAIHDSAMVKAFRPVKGESTGYPDLTLARDKEVIWFELKTEDGMQSSEQRFWQTILPAYHLIRPRDLDTGILAELLR